MARLDEIQKTHDEAMMELRRLRSALRVCTNDQNDIDCAVITAEQAFADLRQYHTQLLCGIDLALQIERSK